MKLHILFEFKSGPQAGGHNFLRTLRDEWKRQGIYSDTPECADGILLNSHHCLEQAIALRRTYPGKTFVLRIDGPMRVYNHDRDDRDDLVAIAARYLADGLIYQSSWSRKENERLYGFGKPACVVLNAPDPLLFSPTRRSPGNKLKILTTGWSMNPNKGGLDLAWADQNLDFSRIEWTVLGGTSSSFRNIRALPAVDAVRLSQVMREHQLFVFPSRFEACSNALLEAVHSGLPALVYGGSSNVELVHDPRMHFSTTTEMKEKIEYALHHYEEIATQVSSLPKIGEVAEKYRQFFADRAGHGAESSAFRALLALKLHPVRRLVFGGRA